MIKYFKKIALTSFSAGILCCGFLALSSPAEACCIYNNTIIPLKFDRLRDEISPSNHSCTNGTGGKFYLVLMDPFREFKASNEISIKVDDHGWISVYKKSGGKWKVVSKHKDGSVKDVKYMTPL